MSIITTINGEVISREAVLAKELERSRVTLALLKERLGVDKMRELLAADTEQMVAKFRQWGENTREDQMRASVTYLDVEGLSVEEFFDYFEYVLEHNLVGDMLGAMPEHYIIDTHGTYQELIENIGMYQLPTHGMVHYLDASETGLPCDPQYSRQMCVKIHDIKTGDYLKIMAFHEFANTDKGMKIKLAVYFPANSPDELVSEHQWHLAIEFSNWIEMAKKRLGRI